MIKEQTTYCVYNKETKKVVSDFTHRWQIAHDLKESLNNHEVKYEIGIIIEKSVSPREVSPPNLIIPEEKFARQTKELNKTAEQSKKSKFIFK